MMKMYVNEEGLIVLNEVYLPLILVTNDNETLIITMRDSGFEIKYEKNFIEMKKGEIIKH